MIITNQRIWGLTKPPTLVIIALCALLFAASPVVRSSTAQTLTEQNMELQQLLAPIALYPDTVLNQVLTAATRPLEVVQAQRWLEQNRTLAADDAVMAASLEGWHPSVAALVAFPDLLEQMSFDLAWTEALGLAVLQNQALVLEQVQFLRQRAYVAGTVQQMDNIRFRSEQRVWIVEPVITQRVYIPYYDTRWVYGSWWWHKPPRNWYHPHRKGYRTATNFYWGTQVTFGSAQVSLWTPVWREGRLNWGGNNHHHTHKRPATPRYRAVQPSHRAYWVDRDNHNHRSNRDRATHVPSYTWRESNTRTKRYESDRHERKERKGKGHADADRDRRNQHYSTGNRSKKRDSHDVKRAKREYLSDRQQKRVANDRLIHPRGERRSPGR